MDNRKVGELIRRLRKESHMTQLQLAEKLHVSRFLEQLQAEVHEFDKYTKGYGYHIS